MLGRNPSPTHVHMVPGWGGLRAGDHHPPALCPLLPGTAPSWVPPLSQPESCPLPFSAGIGMIRNGSFQ